jgi:hypothetical protein
MRSEPSKIAETVVRFFIPTSCREEILGDLHERFKSGSQYAMDALRTVPLVIFSRMRRTADPQVLVIQAFALYASFLVAAWLSDGYVLRQQWGLLRLAIPAVIAFVGLMLNDTYATPGRQSPLKLARGPLVGVIMALASEELLRGISPTVALPGWVALYGSGMSLLLSSAVCGLFPPVTQYPHSANAGAFWLKQAGGSQANSEGMLRVMKGALASVALAVLGMGIAKRAVLPGTIGLLLVLFVVYQWLKPGS